jgi:PilZ domain-containing protein
MIALLKMPAASDAGRNLERRIFPRREFRAEVQGRRLDHTIAALRQPVLTMSLRDLSAGGLCALSDVPIPAGECVAINVPASMTFGGWDAYGRVIRCTPSGAGYRVAIEFDRLPAA